MNYWQDEFKKFQQPHAKLLYMLYYFFKNGYIGNQMKFKLKGKIPYL
jgi:hypothetical protein